MDLDQAGQSGIRASTAVADLVLVGDVPAVRHSVVSGRVDGSRIGKIPARRLKQCRLEVDLGREGVAHREGDRPRDAGVPRIVRGFCRDQIGAQGWRVPEAGVGRAQILAEFGGSREELHLGHGAVRIRCAGTQGDARRLNKPRIVERVGHRDRGRLGQRRDRSLGSVDGIHPVLSDSAGRIPVEVLEVQPHQSVTPAECVLQRGPHDARIHRFIAQVVNPEGHAHVLWPDRAERRGNERAVGGIQSNGCLAVVVRLLKVARPAKVVHLAAIHKQRRVRRALCHLDHAHFKRSHQFPLPCVAPSSLGRRARKARAGPEIGNHLQPRKLREHRLHHLLSNQVRLDTVLVQRFGGVLAGVRVIPERGHVFLSVQNHPDQAGFPENPGK